MRCYFLHLTLNNCIDISYGIKSSRLVPYRVICCVIAIDLSPMHTKHSTRCI